MLSYHSLSLSQLDSFPPNSSMAHFDCRRILATGWRVRLKTGACRHWILALYSLRVSETICLTCLLYMRRVLHHRQQIGSLSLEWTERLTELPQSQLRREKKISSHPRCQGLLSTTIPSRRQQLRNPTAIPDRLRVRVLHQAAGRRFPKAKKRALLPTRRVLKTDSLSARNFQAMTWNEKVVE